MTTAFQLLVNGQDKTPPSADVDSAAEWDATWEERIDGVGTASFTLQDRLGIWDYGHDRDEVEMLVSGDRVYHGEITRSRLELPAGRPWGKWKVSASDFNTVLDLRLVGVPDGRHFVSIDNGTQGPPPTGTWDPVDLNAHSESTDALTIQALFDHYARLPDGSTFDTTTFVNSYINAAMLQDIHGKPLLHWTHTTLRSSIDELVGLGAFPIFYWIDPSDAVHWVNFRDFTTGTSHISMGPHPPAALTAPAVLTDSSPDHTTSIGFRDLSIEFDGTYMPEQAYIGGITDYVFNGPHDVTLQGTGFEQHDIADKSKRQIFVDGQTMNQAQKNALAKAYLQFGERARVKGSVTVGQPTEAIDGWHCGQLVKIYDARLPAWLNGKSFPIHRVAGSLKAGNDFRVYTLEFGDAPLGRFSQKYRGGAQRLPTARLASRIHTIYWPTHHLEPSREYVLTSQMKDKSHKPVRHKGVPVKWTLTVTDRAGATVSTGSIVPIDPVSGDTTTNTTDSHGATSATLHTGSAKGLHYRVRAVTVAQQADAGALVI